MTPPTMVLVLGNGVAAGVGSYWLLLDSTHTEDLSMKRGCKEIVVPVDR